MSIQKSHEKILILDFGSQYTQLIARKIREFGVFTEILPYNAALPDYKQNNIRGLILSGGPSSVYADNAPHISEKLLNGDIPVLGICYGLQLIMHLCGGEVMPASEKEYGKANIR